MYDKTKLFNLQHLSRQERNADRNNHSRAYLYVKFIYKRHIKYKRKYFLLSQITEDVSNFLFPKILCILYKINLTEIN